MRCFSINEPLWIIVEPNQYWVNPAQVRFFESTNCERVFTLVEFCLVFLFKYEIDPSWSDRCWLEELRNECLWVLQRLQRVEQNLPRKENTRDIWLELRRTSFIGSNIIFTFAQRVLWIWESLTDQENLDSM